jgi:hypothetical protein
MFELEILAIRYVFSCTCLGGVAPPFHFGVYVSGHFKDLTEGAFLPPPAFSLKKHAGAAVSPTVKSLK